MTLIQECGLNNNNNNNYNHQSSIFRINLITKSYKNLKDKPRTKTKYYLLVTQMNKFKKNIFLKNLIKHLIME